MTHDPLCPHPPELQEKFRRLGWGNWIPTPGVPDEEREIYISLDGGDHIHLMSIQEALALSDRELQIRIEIAMGMSYRTACELRGVVPGVLPGMGGDEG